MQDVRELVYSTKGKIFSLEYVKLNGESRVVNCRLGVHKHTNGKGKNYDDRQHNLVTVFDMQKNAYRSLKVDGIISLTINGETILV